MRTALLALLVIAGCQDAAVSRQLGARCDTSRQCDDRCLPPDTSYPGGFCTLVCNTSDECPTGAACADREGGVCLFGCVDDTDCTFLGTGWTCKDTDEHGVADKKVKLCRGD